MITVSSPAMAVSRMGGRARAASSGSDRVGRCGVRGGSSARDGSAREDSAREDSAREDSSRHDCAVLMIAA
jgi:hypothetical protein